MIEKIYLDMDGVLADFHKRYVELFGKTPSDARDKKEFNPHWKYFVQTEQFKTLDWWHDGIAFFSGIVFLKHTYNIEVEILSSSGGKKYHDKVKEQKLFWLKERDIHYKANIVSGRKEKKHYATSSKVILVDDTEDVIDEFNAAGGIGILHKDAFETLNRIKSLVDEA